MAADEIILELDRFCIETAARMQYRDLAARILESDLEDPWAERALELLTEFLANEDFRAIRTAHPELSGGHPARVRVFRDQSGVVRWETLWAGLP